MPFTVSTFTSATEFHALAPLEPFVGVGGITLRINGRSWPAGTSSEAVMNGTALPSEFVATQDGRPMHQGWHQGETTDDVYFERFEVVAGLLVRVSHGWIDATTRQLVQAG